MVVHLPAYISLDEAARRSRLDRASLTRLVEVGRIRAVRVNGGVAVAEEDIEDIRELPIPIPSDEMRGRAIRAKDAVEKYKIASHSTLVGWQKRGVVRALSRGHKHVTYDEYTVAAAAQTYHSKQSKRGVRYKTNRHGGMAVGGGVAVMEEDIAVVTKEQFTHLRGQCISLQEASRRYKVAPSTLHSWVHQGHIGVLTPPEERGQGRALALNEQDVAYCATRYHLLKEQRGSVVGMRIFAA